MVGELGSGKTLSLTYLAWKNWHDKNRDIYSNYKLYDIPYTPIKTIGMLNQMREGFVAFDEMWISLDARTSTTERNRIVSNILARSRKRGLTIAFTTQSMSQVDRRIRKVMDFIAYPLMNVDNTYCKLFIFQGPNASWPPLKQEYFYCPPVFELYDSVLEGERIIWYDSKDRLHVTPIEDIPRYGGRLTLMGRERFETDIRVPCFDPSTGNTGLAPVEAFLRHKYSGDAFKIETKTGRTIRTTGDHSVYKWWEEGERFIPFPVRDLEFGDLVAVHPLPGGDEGVGKVHGERVVSILPVPSTEYVYDLSVPEGHHNFTVASQIIARNTEEEPNELIEDIIGEEKPDPDEIDLRTIFRSKGTSERKTCIPPGGADVITRDGVKPIEEVSVGDMVLTHKGEFSRVVETLSREYEGDIVSVETYGNESVTLTADHPVFTLTDGHDRFTVTPGEGGVWNVWKEGEVLSSSQSKSGAVNHARRLAKDTRPAVVSVHSSGGMISNNISFDRGFKWESADDVDRFLFPDPVPFYSNVEFEVNDFTSAHVSGDTVTALPKSTREGKAGKEVNRFIELDEDFARLLGWYTAEGCFSHNSDTYTNILSITHSDPDVIERLSEIYKSKFGVSPRIKDEGRILRLVSDTRVIGEFISSLCGEKSGEKHIPDEVLFNEDTDILRAYFDALWKGDGHSCRGRKGYTTVSKDLAYDVKMALVRFGRRPYINKRRHSGFTEGKEESLCYEVQWDPDLARGERVNGNRSYWHEGYLVGFPKKVRKKSYEGKVYNIEVKGDRSYVTTSFAVHNCPRCGGDGFIQCSECGGEGTLEAVRKDEKKGPKARAVAMWSKGVTKPEIAEEIDKYDLSDVKLVINEHKQTVERLNRTEL